MCVCNGFIEFLGKKVCGGMFWGVVCCGFIGRYVWKWVECWVCFEFFCVLGCFVRIGGCGIFCCDCSVLGIFYDVVWSSFGRVICVWWYFGVIIGWWFVFFCYVCFVFWLFVCCLLCLFLCSSFLSWSGRVLCLSLVSLVLCVWSMIVWEDLVRFFMIIGGVFGNVGRLIFLKVIVILFFVLLSL